jgi:hypothetical protein
VRLSVLSVLGISIKHYTLYNKIYYNAWYSWPVLYITSNLREVRTCTRALYIERKTVDILWYFNNTLISYSTRVISEFPYLKYYRCKCNFGGFGLALHQTVVWDVSILHQTNCRSGKSGKEFMNVYIRVSIN